MPNRDWGRPAKSRETLSFARRAFTDHDLKSLPLHSDVWYKYEEVDFSCNKLSAESLRMVLDVCRRCECLRVLKLFKNGIDDNGARSLATFIQRCPTMEEMHLSHNNFTADGVKALVRAVCRTRPKDAAPLWLRLEQNDVENADRVFRQLQQEGNVCGREDTRRCQVSFCKHGAQVHLPYFLHQRGCDWSAEGGSWGNSSRNVSSDDWCDRAGSRKRAWSDRREPPPEEDEKEMECAPRFEQGGIFGRAMTAMLKPSPQFESQNRSRGAESPRRGDRDRLNAPPRPVELKLTSRAAKRSRVERPRYYWVRVTNVPADLETEDIIEAFEAESKGPVVCCDVNGDVAMVAFGTEEDARGALGFDKGQLNDRTIRVTLARTTS